MDGIGGMDFEFSNVQQTGKALDKDRKRGDKCLNTLISQKLPRWR